MQGIYLFRAKKLGSNKWTCGHLVHTGDFTNGDDGDKYLRDYWVITNGYTQHEVDPNTVGQCSGRRFGNTMTFKDDIVWDAHCEKYGIIVWDDQECGFRVVFGNVSMSLGNFGSSELSVAGNIYDNPELLES